MEGGNRNLWTLDVDGYNAATLYNKHRLKLRGTPLALIYSSPLYKRSATGGHIIISPTPIYHAVGTSVSQCYAPNP